MVEFSANFLRQYVIVISVNLTAIGMGMTFSWTSPMLVKLMKEDTQLSERISEEDASWIVSIGFLTSVVFCPVSFWLTDLLGRKKIMLYFSFVRTAVILMYIFATEVWMLETIRGITGVCEIGILSNIPAYSAEIASKQIRGALGTMGQMSVAIGILIMLSVGPYASYMTVNIMYISVAVLVIIPLFFIPDSPYSMLKRGLTDDALKTMTYLRGSEIVAQEEIKEMTTISGQNTNRKTLFRDTIFLKALSIVTILNIGMQSVGYIAVSLYLQSILEATNTSVSSDIVSVIFGVMQLLACSVTAILSDKAGRKPILAITLAGLSIGMVGLGSFFYVKDSGREIEGFLNYLPLTSLVIIVLCYNAGMGSLCTVLSAELFESSTSRSIGISVAFSITMTVGFFNIKYFTTLISILGSAVVFWSFAVSCLVFMLFILFCVPETKQKSFLEIQRALGRKDVLY